VNGPYCIGKKASERWAAKSLVCVGGGDEFSPPPPLPNIGARCLLHQTVACLILNYTSAALGRREQQTPLKTALACRQAFWMRTAISY
jgi:hypothetical protein